MVEVLVGEKAVVDEEEFHTALDGGDASRVVHAADVRVRGEDLGEGGVHGGADGGAEVFNRGEPAECGDAGGGVGVW